MRACKVLKFSKKVANRAPHQLEWTIALNTAHEFSNKLAKPHKSQGKRTIAIRQPSVFSNRQCECFTRGSFWTAGARAALELSKRPPGSHQPSPSPTNLPKTVPILLPARVVKHFFLPIYNNHAKVSLKNDKKHSICRKKYKNVNLTRNIQVCIIKVTNSRL